MTFLVALANLRAGFKYNPIQPAIPKGSMFLTSNPGVSVVEGGAGVTAADGATGTGASFRSTASSVIVTTGYIGKAVGGTYGRLSPVGGFLVVRVGPSS